MPNKTSPPTDAPPAPADDAPEQPPPDFYATVQRIGEAWEQFAAKLAATIEPAIESIAEFSRRLFASVPRHVRKRYMPPTPWHYKRARVELRRAGEPVTGKAVAELAAAIRRGR